MFDRIIAHTSFIGETGYANHSRNFFTALNKIIPVKVRNFAAGKTWTGLNGGEPHNDEWYLTDEHKEMLYKQTCLHDGGRRDHYIYGGSEEDEKGNVLHIILNEVNHHYFYDEYNGPKIVYNVWESTLYPDDFFNKLLEFDQLWVPTKWQRDCVVDQGYDFNKVKVVPEAVDGEIFFPEKVDLLDEYKDERFKFLLLGRWDYRKCTREIIKSFLRVFKNDEPVDLVVSIDNIFATDKIKTTEERLKYFGFDDERIKIKHFPSRDDYIKYLKTGHVFLSCARSEGWNLPLIEAMSCGCPSIYSNWGAQLEFADNKGIPVDIIGEKQASLGDSFKMIPNSIPGKYCEPDFDHLEKIMKDVYVNYKDYKVKALKDSEIIREEFTWEEASKKAMNCLEEFENNEDEIIVNGVKVIHHAPLGLLKGETEARIYEKHFKVKDGDVVVDIGTNIGLFSLSTINRNIKKCYCIEPDAENCKDILINVENSGCSDKFILVEKAIGKETGMGLFDANFDMGVCARVEEGGVSLPEISFLDFIKENNIDDIDFLKLDCEGGEYYIINDERNWDFIKNNVKKIAGEIHLRGDKKDALLLIDNLISMGFSVILESVDGYNITQSFKDNFDYYTEIHFFAESTFDDKKEKTDSDIDIYFESSENKICINPNGAIVGKYTVSVKDISCNLVMHKTEFYFPPDNSLIYWVVPHYADFLKFESMKGFRGFLVEISGDDNYYFSKKLIIKDCDPVDNFIFAEQKIDFTWVNYYEMFYKKIYDHFVCQEDKGTVIDIGANRGIFTRYALSKGYDKCYSIEPEERVFKELDKNFGSESKVSLHQAAIYDHSGRGNIYVPEEGSSISSILLEDAKADGEERGHDMYGNYAEIEVDFFSLKDFVFNNNIGYVDLLKIDAEGAEYGIFEAADESFLRDNINKIILEFHFNTDGRLESIIDKLKNSGFSINIRNQSSEDKGSSNLVQGVIFAKNKQKETFIESIVNEAFSVGMFQVKEEIKSFAEFIEDKDINNVLEIGTDRGGTFYIWCNLAKKDGKKISLDLPYESCGYDIETRNRSMAGWSNNISIIEGDSHDEKYLEDIKQILNGEEIDLLFIDGDHTYDGVKKDYEMYRGLVKEGGIIAFHDIKDIDFHREAGCFVHDLWNEIEGDKKEFRDDEEYGGIGAIINKKPLFNLDDCNNNFSTQDKSSVKVIACYLGYRRKGFFKPAHMLKMLEFLWRQELEVDNGVPTDTLIVYNKLSEQDRGNIEDIENYNKCEKFLYSLNCKKTKNGRCYVVERENIGISYGAFDFAFNLFKDRYYYWMFTEDDHIIIKDDVMKKSIQQLMNSSSPAKKCGFVATSMVSLEKYGFAVHARSGTGCSNRDILNKVVNNNYSDILKRGCLPHLIDIDRKFVHLVKKHEFESEVLFTNKILEMGYELENVNMKDIMIIWGSENNENERIVPCSHIPCLQEEFDIDVTFCFNEDNDNNNPMIFIYPSRKYANKKLKAIFRDSLDNSSIYETDFVFGDLYDNFVYHADLFIDKQRDFFVEIFDGDNLVKEFREYNNIKKMELYQDQYINGEVVQKGIMDCEGRYDAMRCVFDKYDRQFTILDIGANFGYYSIRASDEYDAISIMIEAKKSECKRLVQIVDKNDCRDNAVVLNYKLGVAEMRELVKCEHFDIVLALNVIHHFEEKDILEICYLCDQLGDNLILESPQPGDKGACGQNNIEVIDHYFKNRIKSDLGSFKRHTSDIPSHLYWLVNPKKELISTYYFYDTLKFNGTVGDSLIPLLDKASFRVNSNFYEKYFENPNNGEKRKWINGINLCTYKWLKGVYPYPSIISEKIENKNIETEYKWDNTNKDISVHNFILEGSKIHLIDLVEKSYENVKNSASNDDQAQLAIASDIIISMED